MWTTLLRNGYTFSSYMQMQPVNSIFKNIQYSGGFFQTELPSVPSATCTKYLSLTGKAESAVNNCWAWWQINLIYKVNEKALKGWWGVTKRLTVAALALNGLTEIDSVGTERMINSAFHFHRNRISWLLVQGFRREMHLSVWTEMGKTIHIHS